MTHHFDLGVLLAVLGAFLVRYLWGWIAMLLFVTVGMKLRPVRWIVGKIMKFSIQRAADSMSDRGIAAELEKAIGKRPARDSATASEIEETEGSGVGIGRLRLVSDPDATPPPPRRIRHAPATHVAIRCPQCKAPIEPHFDSHAAAPADDLDDALIAALFEHYLAEGHRLPQPPLAPAPTSSPPEAA